MKFTLTIELGNEAMQTGYDIREAIADYVTIAELIEGGENGLIRDDYGNIVGKWEVTA